MSSARPSTPASAARAWLDRWSPLLPVLIAEFAVLVGFGAVLPILPLYLVSYGIDNALLGLIIAAWPLAKLIAEPVFGYLADRRARRPIMLIALVILAVAIVMPLWFTTAPAFFVSRLIGGLATGMYDPAARGIIVDATTEDRRGEAFGLYGSFQMGGLILGPVIGSVAAAVFGGYAFSFILTGVLVLVAAVFLWAKLRDVRTVPGAHAASRAGAPSRPTGPSSPRSHLGPGGEELSTGLVGEAAIEASHHHPPLPGSAGRLLNPLLLAAVVMQLSFSFSTGVYEVIWSLFMAHLGASVAWIGFTFTLFAVPVMILSPLAGRLVDRYGGMRFAVLGCLAVSVAGLIYTQATEPVMPALVGLLEACGFAFVGPALFWLLARGTPPGRTSTAQGIFGAAGTTGTIVSSLAAGVLWGMDIRYPFYLFVGVSLAGMALAVVIARRAGSAATAPAGAA